MKTDKPKLLSDAELLDTGPSGFPRWMERDRELARLREHAKEDERTKNRREIDEWLERHKAKAKDRDKGG